MESTLLENKKIFKRDETEGNLIRLYPNNSMIDNTQDEKITITVPKGYKAKVILEKEDERSEISETVESTTLNEKKLNGIFSSNAMKEIAATSMTAVPPVTMTQIYDIIRLHRESESLIKRFEGYNINEEELDMKKSLMYDVLKEQIKFLIIAVCFIIVSLIGIIVFNRTGFYIIHPLLYIITLLMGIGWGATALASIKNNKV